MMTMTQSSRPLKLIITGGGTGGHVFGGIAIAQEFLNQNPKNDVLFIGSSQGMEVKLVPRAGYKLELLQLGKLVGQKLLTRISTLFQIPIAILKSYRIIKKFKADMVIGVGGYAAGPCIVAARLCGIPIGVLEQNSVVGFTNRISASLANKIFLAFEGVPAGISKQKCLVTGNPARSTMKPSSQEKKVPPAIIFAFGGSQGATGINKLMTEASLHLKDESKNIRFIHQTGEKDFEWVKEFYEKNQFPAETHKFIDGMQAMYDAATLVVCRSGSGTIAELGATENAAVFIPFPLAAGDHQTLNARKVENAGAAKVLIQGQTTGADLARELRTLLQTPERLNAMRTQMKQFYRPQASAQIISEMIQFVGKQQ